MQDNKQIYKLAVKRLKRKGHFGRSNKKVLEKLKASDSKDVKRLFEQARKVILKTAKRLGFYQ